MLIKKLVELWFSKKEAKVYVANLSLWNALVSSIARQAWENRITTYSILKDFKQRGVAQELTQNKVKYFTVISPEKLLEREKQKYELLHSLVPELMALSENYDNKPKVYYYEGIERLKELFLEILEEGNSMGDVPFLTFIGTTKIDSKFETFLEETFVPLRLKCQTKTKAIVAKSISYYANYNKDVHDSVIVEDPLFEMGNEIVLYGKYKVAILSFSEGELFWIVVRSETFFRSLKNIFDLLWRAYKK